MRARRIGLALLGTGLMFLAVCGGAWIHRTVSSHSAVKRFEAEQAQSSGANFARVNDSASGAKVDFTLWSAKRMETFKDSLFKKGDRPFAVVRIPKIRVEVPVYNDTDDLTLDRGVGRILGTAKVGEAGNLGIAGHRDGFFRGLKDLTPGDEIELVHTGRTDTYVVDKIQIVYPEDVSVLKPTRGPSQPWLRVFPSTTSGVHHNGLSCTPP